MKGLRRSIRENPVGWRLAVSVWLVYSMFATTNVVRETYLAISLGASLSAKVDRFAGLHPDLFEMPGRGWYINSSPGASMLGAIPYGLLVNPAIDLATRAAPGIVAPKPPATYDDPRPNRNRFLNAARARGLDIVLPLAAIGTAVTLMAPLGALSALLMFGFLRNRLADERRALWYALLFAFATPQLFRAAFINQNAIIAHITLASWVLMVGISPRVAGAPPPISAIAGTGALLGLALVCDYSAVPVILVFGLWILIDGWRRGGIGAALRQGTVFTAGALPLICLLLAYQWAAFGSPWWPAQRYMPPTEYSVRGWFGFTLPSVDLLIGNLLDLRYGLFAFCPLLVLALAAPFTRRSPVRPSSEQLGWLAAVFAALLVFSSANQFANLQWNTGVRYMVPVVPLLFVAAVPVIEAMPRLAARAMVLSSLVISLAVTMTREDVLTGLRLLFTEGPTLPVLAVMRKVASGYTDLPSPALLFWLAVTLATGTLWLVWRGAVPPRTRVSR